MDNITYFPTYKKTAEEKALEERIQENMAGIDAAIRRFDLLRDFQKQELVLDILKAIGYTK